MTILVKKQQFAGSSKVFGTDSDALVNIVRGMAQHLALSVAGQVTDLTDNSGAAAANGVIEAVGLNTLAVLGTTDCAQKAALEAAYGTVLNGLSTMITQVNLIRAKVPAFAALTDSTGGTDGAGTIAAVTLSVSGVGASLASAAGANTTLTLIKNRIAQLTIFVNKLATATGQTLVVDSSGGAKSYGTTFAAVSTNTGTAVSGADVTVANAAIKATDASAKLAILGNAVKELATKLNAITGVTTLGAVPVVAV